MFSNGASFGNSGAALGPFAAIADSQRISPRLDPWPFRAVTVRV